MTTAIALPDLGPAETVAAQAQTTAEQLEATMKAITVTTAEQAQWAIDAAHQLRQHQKALEAEKEFVAKPLRDLARKHSQRWKPAIDAVGRAIAHLKTQALGYQAYERARQAAALQAATSQAEVAQAVAVVAPSSKGLQERVAWTWEVEDLTKVPREYFVLDTARLDREAREKKGELAVPGIKPVRKTIGVLR